MDRTYYVARRFEQYLQGTVLDVGCFEAQMREILGKDRYTGIDFVGNPDIHLNLQDIEDLPFDDNSFDTVICIEVLEHLDNLHLMFHELIRVAKKNIIVSLPNCWRDARVPIERGKGHFAHYGLSIDQPKDRHRWFFNIDDAYQFMVNQQEQSGIQIVECFASEKPRNFISTGLRKLRYPGFRYVNRYAQTLWTAFEK